MELKEIFEERIKIEPKVMAIETIFNNTRRLNKTNFKPPYQRKYVWDDEKATYFIESIILGTEIPPLIFFNNTENIEVIDGRQRYETILRFLKNDFKLKKSGLHKFTELANKNFNSFDNKLKDIFWDTKLRIIEFSFHSPSLVDADIELRVKNEIFKRYNSGITPLKAAEVDKAVFFENDLNSYFKTEIRKDRLIFDDITDVFFIDKNEEETMLKKIRRLIVLHHIPIKRYSSQKDIIINRFYEYLSENIEETEQKELYKSFVRKINILKRLNEAFGSEKKNYNHLISECVFWALQIIETEKGLSTINDNTISKLAKYIIENIDSYKDEQSSFAKILQQRYELTAHFFEQEFDLNYSIYLKSTDDFKEKEKELNTNNKSTEELSGVETLRINKPEPSSITIEDIVRQLKRDRFLIRPPYQRKEVINRSKSSAIIESILLGIKIPPIFIFKRKDGISEVLDGQQRLLSILGFIREEYLDENQNIAKSEKDGYALNLKDGILNLHRKTFEELPQAMKDRILEFDLWKIDIEEENNPNFDPIDLFIRLNYKPYPIKENTFEMWNSYIDREIIERIKALFKNNEKWFYFRKSDTRMDNESLYTALVYMQYKLNETNPDLDSILTFLDIYKIGDKINFRLKEKREITKIIENRDYKDAFLKAASDLESVFIGKVALLCEKGGIPNDTKLNEIFNVENRRTQQRFYALWFFLSNISKDAIAANREGISNQLKNLFILMDKIETKQQYLEEVNTIWVKYKSYEK